MPNYINYSGTESCKSSHWPVLSLLGVHFLHQTPLGPILCVSFSTHFYLPFYFISSSSHPSLPCSHPNVSSLITRFTYLSLSSFMIWPTYFNFTLYFLFSCFWFSILLLLFSFQRIRSIAHCVFFLNFPFVLLSKSRFPLSPASHVFPLGTLSSIIWNGSRFVTMKCFFSTSFA